MLKQERESKSQNKMQCFTATLLSKYLLTNDEPDDFDFDDDDTYDVDVGFFHSQGQD